MFPSCNAGEQSQHLVQAGQALYWQREPQSSNMSLNVVSDKGNTQHQSDRFSVPRFSTLSGRRPSHHASRWSICPQKNNFCLDLHFIIRYHKQWTKFSAFFLFVHLFNIVLPEMHQAPVRLVTLEEHGPVDYSPSGNAWDRGRTDMLENLIQARPPGTHLLGGWSREAAMNSGLA